MLGHAVRHLESAIEQSRTGQTEQSRTGQADLLRPADPGIPVLARLVAAVDPAAAVTASAAATAWARTAGRGPARIGLLNGGLAGTLAGLRLAAWRQPPLRAAADKLRDHLAHRATRDLRTESVSFADYDLISGPAGVLLALCATDPPAPEHLRTLTEHLAALCDRDGLPRLRIGAYRNHPHLAWVHGRINTGMAHGVAGLISALTAVTRRVGADPALIGALGRATHWLASQAYEDGLGIPSWPGAGLDGAAPPAAAARRQAWCYGTPGVAWALFDAADALGDQAAARRAADVFTALADRFDPAFHLHGDRPEDLLGLCHGAAGVLAVADAFDRHARLPAATVLRNRLVRHLLARLEDAPVPAAHGLLEGAPGILAALLTATCGEKGEAPRAWLTCLGLR
ncbi:MAG TPA: lanthionine synthetase LanC family protein [Actinospica sp.]|nr:lanthionine synthetase LanC family protein [Actinospica sp.]